MNLDIINSDLQDYLKTKDLKLFEVTYHKGDKTLSIILDEKLDMNKLEEVSNDLSTYMDKYAEEFEDNYILDISTVGVERPIRNEDELARAVGSYIYCKGKDFEYNGTLNDYSDGIMKLEYMDKNIKKNVSIEYKNVKQVRYAVKF